MQFKVPQNIDMADRIVGPLTLVQFLYILIGGIVVYFLFTTVGAINGALFLLLAAPIALFTLAMAFLKVQDQPFPRFVVALAIYLVRPKTRRWHKASVADGLKIIPETVAGDKQKITPKKITKSRLEHLIQMMDTGALAPARPAAGTPKSAVSPTTKVRHG